MIIVIFQPVKISIAGAQDARLAFVDEALVAVLVRLPSGHGDEAGRWFLETGYGGVDGVAHPTFADLEEARLWIAGRLTRR